MCVSAGVFDDFVKSVMNTRTSLGSHSGFAMTTFHFIGKLSTDEIKRLLRDKYEGK